jgi:hypothetical protein
MSDVEVMTEGAALLQEAVHAAKRGDDGIARSLLLRASEIEPSLDLIWLWLARLSSSPADKTSYLRRVLALQPGHEVARSELADILSQEGIAAAKGGSRKRARTLLESSIELDSGKVDSWLWLAAVSETKEERRRNLARVLAIDPLHRQALALLDLLDARDDAGAEGSSAIETDWQDLLLDAGWGVDETKPGASGGDRKILRSKDHVDHEPSRIVPTNDRSGTMANIKESLQDLAGIDGFIGACLVDSNSGMMMGSEGGGATLDLEAAAAGNTEVVRAKRKTMAMLGLKDTIEDILITLGKQYHLIRPLATKDGLFIYLVLDKSRSNLALSRHKLADTEKNLVV